jgi:hypothetical protein
VIAAALFATVPMASAQLNGLNIKGDMGLKSGSQAPPGVYFVLPVWLYSADKLMNGSGEEVAAGQLNANIFGLGVNLVTGKKLLGSNYGFLLVFAGANNRIQGGERLDSDPGAGISDTYVQPLNLGWHTSRADVTFATGLYLPTGRYADGDDDNTGLGMWGYELLAGTMLYLDKAKAFHLATTATFNLHSNKKDSDTKVGNILNLEGGLSRDFMGGGLTVGAAYYATFKLTDD